jgi:two-component system LytT family response regulator
MKILIVDDEPLARERIREMLKNEPQIVSIDEAENGAQAVEQVRAALPDIVFLDIQMPDMDGFQVLETLDLKNSSRVPAIVFVTAYDQYALRAFEFHALDYLLKPFDRERFAETFALVKERIKQQNDAEYQQRMFDLLEKMNRSEPEYLEWLTIKKDERIKILRAEDIHWIEAQGNYVSLKFDTDTEMLRETMDNLEAQVNPRVFVRVHRSAIVNVGQIKELQVWARGEYRILMKDGRTFPLSRTYRSRLNTFLNNRLL